MPLLPEAFSLVGLQCYSNGIQLLRELKDSDFKEFLGKSKDNREDKNKGT